MNLAIRSMYGDLGKYAADTFTEDLHKDLKADFILANPPFNLEWEREKVENRQKSPQKRSDLCFFSLIILLFNLFCISLHNNSYLKQNGLQQQTPFHGHHPVLSHDQHGACSGREYGYHR